MFVRFATTYDHRNPLPRRIRRPKWPVPRVMHNTPLVRPRLHVHNGRVRRFAVGPAWTCMAVSGWGGSAAEGPFSTSRYERKVTTTTTTTNYLQTLVRLLIVRFSSQRRKGQSRPSHAWAEERPGRMRHGRWGSASMDGHQSRPPHHNLRLLTLVLKSNTK